MSRAEDRLGCLWGGIVVALAIVGWMVATNARAPRDRALLETSLGGLGYGGIVDAYPAGGRGWDCERDGERFVWKTTTMEGEACVYADAVEILNARPLRENTPLPP